MTKRIRLRGGKWITKVLPESNPAELAAALECEVWECGDGRKILVKDMDPKHILNVIATLERRVVQDCAKFGTTPEKLAAATFPVYVKLHEEFAKRLKQLTDATHMMAEFNKSAVQRMKQPELPAPKEEERTRMFSLD